MNVAAYPASYWWEKNRTGWGGWGGLIGLGQAPVVTGSGQCIDGVLSHAATKLSDGTTIPATTVMTACPAGATPGTTIYPSQNPADYTPNLNVPTEYCTSLNGWQRLVSPCCTVMGYAIPGPNCPAQTPMGSGQTQGSTPNQPTAPSPCAPTVNYVTTADGSSPDPNAISLQTNSDGSVTWAVPINTKNCTDQQLQAFFNNLANLPANQPASCGSWFSQAFNPSCTWGSGADCSDFMNQLFNPSCPMGAGGWMAIAAVGLVVLLLAGGGVALLRR